MKMEDVALIISILALLGSLISLFFSYQANTIEKDRDKLELEKGKIALLNLTAQYFVSNLQRIDFVGTTFNVKKDNDYTINYIKELESIATRFDELGSNNYFAILYKHYPVIGFMSVFIRKEIMFINIFNSKKQQYGLDNVVWNRMFSTFEVLRNEVKFKNTESAKILENEVYLNSKQINDFLSKK